MVADAVAGMVASVRTDPTAPRTSLRLLLPLPHFQPLSPVGPQLPVLWEPPPPCIRTLPPTLNRL